MKSTTLLLLTLVFITWLTPGNARAQTVRVTTGTNADGSKSYMEVYEFDYVDVKPEFPGGGNQLINFINENRRYPAEAYAQGIEGRVTCAFVVNTNGNISNLSVIRGVEPSLNKEALRILSKMPQWSPGKINGQAVPVRVIWCIPFRK